MIEKGASYLPPYLRSEKTKVVNKKGSPVSLEYLSHEERQELLFEELILFIGRVRELASTTDLTQHESYLLNETHNSNYLLELRSQLKTGRYSHGELVSKADEYFTQIVQVIIKKVTEKEISHSQLYFLLSTLPNVPEFIKVKKVFFNSLAGQESFLSLEDKKTFLQKYEQLIVDPQKVPAGKRDWSWKWKTIAEQYKNGEELLWLAINFGLTNEVEKLCPETISELAEFLRVERDNPAFQRYGDRDGNTEQQIHINITMLCFYQLKGNSRQVRRHAGEIQKLYHQLHFDSSKREVTCFLLEQILKYQLDFRFDDILTNFEKICLEYEVESLHQRTLDWDTKAMGLIYLAKLSQFQKGRYPFLKSSKEYLERIYWGGASGSIGKDKVFRLLISFGFFHTFEVGISKEKSESALSHYFLRAGYKTKAIEELTKRYKGINYSAIEGNLEHLLENDPSQLVFFLQNYSPSTPRRKWKSDLFSERYIEVSQKFDTSEKSIKYDSITEAELQWYTFFRQEDYELHYYLREKCLDEQDPQKKIYWLGQLAYFAYEVPVLFTNFLYENKLLPPPSSDSHSSAYVETLLDQLRRLSNQEYIYKMAYEPELRETISYLTKINAIKSIKPLILGNVDHLTLLHKFLLEQKQEKIPKIALFLRKIFDRTPTQYLNTILFVITLPKNTSLSSHHRKLDLLHVDWSDEEEQEILLQAVQETHAFSPVIFDHYRKIEKQKRYFDKPSAAKELQYIEERIVTKQNFLSKVEGTQDSNLLKAQEDSKKLLTELFEKKQKLQQRIHDIEASPEKIQQLQTAAQEYLQWIMELREKFHTNVPITEVIRNTSQFLDSDDMNGLIAEIILALYQPIGFDFDDILDFLKGKNEDSLLSSEPETVSHARVLQLGDQKMWKQKGMVFDPEKQSITAKLEEIEIQYKVNKKDLPSFKRSRNDLVNALNFLPKKVSEFLAVNGRLTKANIQAFQIFEINQRSLRDIQKTLLILTETFGLWFEDNKETILSLWDGNEDEMKSVQTAILNFLKKNREFIKSKEIQGTRKVVREVEFFVSKNVGSFFARGATGLCTAGDTKSYKRSDFGHLNGADKETKQVLSNIQVYLVPVKEYLDENAEEDEVFLMIRGLNPAEPVVNQQNAKSWLRLCVNLANGLSSANKLRGAFLVQAKGWHPHTNRPVMGDVMQEEIYSKVSPIALKKPFPITGAWDNLDNAQFVDKVFPLADIVI